MISSLGWTCRLKKVWPLESLPSIFWWDPNLYDFISYVESKRRYFERMSLFWSIQGK